MAKKNKKPEKLPRIVAGALADAFGNSFTTIDRWALEGDDRLTSEKAKRVFEQLKFVFDSSAYIDTRLAKATA